MVGKSHRNTLLSALDINRANFRLNNEALIGNPIETQLDIVLSKEVYFLWRGLPHNPRCNLPFDRPALLIELASSELQIILLCQDDNTIAALAHVADETQWSLTKDLAAVKLDQSHYFFSFQPPKETEDSDSNDDDEKEKKKNKKEKVRKEVEEKEVMVEVGAMAREVIAGELNTDKKKMEAVEGQCVAHWTKLALNVEEYSGMTARLITVGSGHLVKEILCCGDVAVDRLKSGSNPLAGDCGPCLRMSEFRLWGWAGGSRCLRSPPLQVLCTSASVAQRSQILSMLLDRSVNPDLLNRHKQTPLLLAATHRKISCVKKLTEAGANVSRTQIIVIKKGRCWVLEIITREVVRFRSLEKPPYRHAYSLNSDLRYFVL
ncbi:unnamed protein product [Fraxinus pennsylvanica]|uniref:Uncharacterized protein n=1 Tax=Fraxinus pennsylvanica TaxID=56036 RepID=A0AAD1YV16_9LAMI|nr:unnamed protein product [Fraxinus pennsylvanica]